MPKTIQCVQCGVVLNLPPQAAGKRLKCPKCGTKFQVDSDTTKYPSTEHSAHDATPASSQELPRKSSHDLPRKSSHDLHDLPLPSAPGDLRETFDLPLMSEAAPSSGVAPGAQAQAADALALFDEKKPAPRRPNAAEARAKSRRCPTCGGGVPAGMSICSTCGLDLETGTRIVLDEDLMPEAPKRAAGPPLPVTVIALISLVGCLMLAVFSLMKWKGGEDGWQYFVPICLFGAFASVHLLRGHTAKLLIVALSLGAMVNVAAFIVMPIFQASEETKIEQRPVAVDDPNVENVAIQPMTERLDTNRLSLGIVNLIVYALVAAYLSSPAVRRHYARN